MQYIDEKFKDASPEATVERIRNILKSINIDVDEHWYESGLENCHSLTLTAGGSHPTSNGKGVTREFARASAYGEFIERLQSGLFFYKFQGFENDPAVNLQCFAPDGKYFTKEELIENADWFDYLCDSYKGLTREALASQCQMYAHTNDGRILCVPFYSLFEDKYVYLPVGFIEHMYSANGCCVGNTKEEALVHALSEIMERKASTTAVINGNSFPAIPDDVLMSFPTVAKIMKRLRECEDLEVTIFDCSIGNGFPVVGTRIINRISHGYHVNFAADPVLEIAIQRSLTETFQSRNIATIALNDYKPILNNTSGVRVSANVLNQLEIGKGNFTADFFAEELTCQRKATDFEDNSNLTNTQLLKKTLELFKALKQPVLVRNYDFLGFPCYKVIIPGFSESRAMRLLEPVQEYAMGEEVSRILRNPKAFDKAELSIITLFNQMISSIISRKGNFTRLSGIPLRHTTSVLLWDITMAYIHYRMGNLKSAAQATDNLTHIAHISPEDKGYFTCVRQYLTLILSGTPEDKQLSILNKFNKKVYVEKLMKALESGTPFDEYLLECNPEKCAGCRYNDVCHYTYIKELIKNTGEAYSKFTDGQSKEHFASFIS